MTYDSKKKTSQHDNEVMSVATLVVVVVMMVGSCGKGHRVPEEKAEDQEDPEDAEVSGDPGIKSALDIASKAPTDVDSTAGEVKEPSARSTVRFSLKLFDLNRTTNEAPPTQLALFPFPFPFLSLRSSASCFPKSIATLNRLQNGRPTKGIPLSTTATNSGRASFPSTTSYDPSCFKWFGHCSRAQRMFTCLKVGVCFRIRMAVESMLSSRYLCPFVREKRFRLGRR